MSWAVGVLPGIGIAFKRSRKCQDTAKVRHGDIINIRSTDYLSPFLLLSVLVHLGFIEFDYFFSSVFLSP